MILRELLEQLANLPLHHRNLEVYVDVEGDEYKEMELVPIVEVDAKDDKNIIGYVICELKPEVEVAPLLPFRNGVH
jgi:hypothetical protein